MKFRDSSGRSTDNPFHFLQQTKKYPVKIKVQELSEREKAEIDFELDYMVTDYQNNKCISKIIMEDGNALQIAQASEQAGFNNLRRSGLKKVMQGVTSLQEINRVTSE